MTFLKTKIFGLLLFISSLTSGQIPGSLFIDSIARKTENILPKNWFLKKNVDGFTVFHCRTCSKYENEKMKEAKITWTTEKNAYKYFKEHGPDSVSFYSLLSLPYIYFPWDTSHPFSKLDTTHPFVKANADQLKEIYRPNGVLKIDVKITEKWAKAHSDTVKAHNDLLSKKIMQQPLGKASPDEFDDFRYWVPQRWKDRTKNYPFFFERLPYESSWYNYSIFIIPDQPFYSSIMYYDKTDRIFYNNPDNEITREYYMIQKSISYSLGINDYFEN